jgi:hypothetical protein
MPDETIMGIFSKEVKFFANYKTEIERKLEPM